jgi:hypothetical protein
MIFHFRPRRAQLRSMVAVLKTGSISVMRQSITLG